MRRPGSEVTARFLLSPRIARFWAIRGDRLAVRWRLFRSGESHFSLAHESCSGRSIVCWHGNCLAPSPLPSPPIQKTFWGRGVSVGPLTQGGWSGSCRCRRPGLLSDARLGLHNEEAASCRFTNVQSVLQGLCCRTARGALVQLEATKFKIRSNLQLFEPPRRKDAKGNSSVTWNVSISNH